MSFAEMMGHNIPNEHEDDYYGFGGDNSSKPLQFRVIKMVHETTKAWLVDIERIDNTYRTWIPKSVCTYSQNNDTIVIPQWLLPKLNPIL